MNEKSFIEAALNGPVEIDEFSSYKVVKLNETQVNNMPEKLIKQLKKENLYDNSYVGLVVLSGMEEFSVEASSLPIYGMKKNFDTSNLSKTKEEAIELDLESKDLKLLLQTNKGRVGV